MQGDGNKEYNKKTVNNRQFKFIEKTNGGSYEKRNEQHGNAEKQSYPCFENSSGKRHDDQSRTGS